MHCGIVDYTTVKMWDFCPSKTSRCQDILGLAKQCFGNGLPDLCFAAEKMTLRKANRQTYGEDVLVVRDLCQCQAVFGFPAPLSFSHQMPLARLGDPHVLFIALDPENNTTDFLRLSFTTSAVCLMYRLLEAALYLHLSPIISGGITVTFDGTV